MALPTSGPLSLTDIQTEFGGTNPISLNEYYAGGGLVPSGTTGTNGAVPSSGAISINSFYGTANFRYFLLGFSESVPFNTGTSVSGGEISGQAIKDDFVWTGGAYRVRTPDGTTTVLRSQITKLNVLNGSVIEQKYDLNTSGVTPISEDSSNNLYLRGFHVSGTSFIAKLNSSYSTLWAYTLSLPAGTIQAMNVGSLGSIYVGGRNAGSSPASGVIIKATSTPVLSWARTITTGTDPNYTVYGVASDSTENLYATGYGFREDTFTLHTAFLVKYNASGTLQWQRKITYDTAPSYIELTDVVVSSDGASVYAVGNLDLDGSRDRGFYAKYNSSGVLQWSIYIIPPNESSTARARGSKLAIGPTGRVFALYSLTFVQTSRGSVYIAEVNPSTGAQIWIRQLRVSNSVGTILSTVLGKGLSVSEDGNEDLIISVSVGTLINLTFKVPSDGSKLGTYTVTAASGTTYNGLYQSTTASVIATSSVTDAAGSYTFASPAVGTLTSTTVDFTQSVPAYDETVLNDIVTIP
jgi:hypothetical protein